LEQPAEAILLALVGASVIGVPKMSPQIRDSTSIKVGTTFIGFSQCLRGLSTPSNLLR
jgi:hypothetical protein